MTMNSIKSTLIVLFFIFLFVASVYPEEAKNRQISKRGITEWRFRRTKQLESDIINSFDMLLVLKPRDEGLASVYSKPIAYKVKLIPETFETEDQNFDGK